MGREWYWGGGKSAKRRGGGGEEKDIASTPSGCMCAVFQLFDFNQFQFPSVHQQQPSLKPDESFLPGNENPIPKGVEAPRNSLELQEPNSLLSTIKEEENLNIPMGIQIKTNGGGSTRSKSHGAASDCSSEIISSPGIKTPTLVARLMGLELLPDHTSSPISSSPNTQARSHFKPRQYSIQNKPIISHRSTCLDSEFSGSRSLPETPRISSARRSDVDYQYHRLSLQINKENMSAGDEEMLLSRISSLRRKELKTNDENRSPGNYARQIVKQVKESVGRKVGLDITNTVSNNREQQLGSNKDELISRFKAKKMSNSKGLANNNVDYDSSPGKHSCSPRLKFLEHKNKPITGALSTKDQNVSNPTKLSLSPPSPQVNIQAHNNNQVSTKPNKSPHAVQVQQYPQPQRAVKKLKKIGGQKFSPLPPARLKKPPQTSDIVRNKQEEGFVRPTTASRGNDSIPDKKCKKTPLSNNLLNNITVPTLLPVKKDPTPPATKIPQKQVPNAQESKRSSSQLSSCLSQSYKQQEATQTLGARDASSSSNNAYISNGAAAKSNTGGDGAAAEEYEYYITRILKRTGINNNNPVSFTSWFSPSHPLDPSIFDHLEVQNFTALENYHLASGQLGYKCNRKLLFHLVDEILVEILRPYINMKPWSSSSSIGRVQNFGHMQGSHLVNMLCTKIRSYPSADCRVLEDIDALIDKDLPQLKDQSEVAFEEEGEGIVIEVEKDVLDTLIHETAMIFFYGD